MMFASRVTEKQQRRGATVPPRQAVGPGASAAEPGWLLQRQLGNSLVAALDGAPLPEATGQPGRPGRPLDPTTRSTMESRFGHDFSGVRVHDHPAAARSADELDATAYTVGQDVVLGAGGYAPDTAAGQRLLAHELAHVAQQGPQPAAAPKRLSLSSSATAEREAHAAAETVSLGRPVRVSERLAPGVVSRQPQAPPAASDVDKEDDRRIQALGITREQLVDWATLRHGDFIDKYGLRFWWNFPRDKVRALPGPLLVRVLPKEDQTLYLQPSGRVATNADETSTKVQNFRPASTALGGTARGVALLAGATPEKAEALGEAGDLLSAGLPVVAAGAARARTRAAARSQPRPAPPPAPPATTAPPAPSAPPATTAPPAPTAPPATTAPPAPAPTAPPTPTAPPAPTTAPTATAPPAPSPAPAAARGRGPRARRRPTQYERRRMEVSGGRWEPLRDDALRRDPTCPFCQARPSETADHVEPLVSVNDVVQTGMMTEEQAREAANHPSNLRGICGPCNSSKSGRPAGDSSVDRSWWTPPNPDQALIDHMRMMRRWPY